MELPKLRPVRLRRLMTQDELSQEVGMTKASISRIETGATKARISTVRKLAEALKVDPAELLGNNEPSSTPEQEGSNP